MSAGRAVSFARRAKMSLRDARSAGMAKISSRFVALLMNFTIHVSRNVALARTMISQIIHVNIATQCVLHAQARDQINAKSAIKLQKLDNFIS
jgi:hypothetical protein